MLAFFIKLKQFLYLFCFLIEQLKDNNIFLVSFLIILIIKNLNIEKFKKILYLQKYIVNIILNSI